MSSVKKTSNGWRAGTLKDLVFFQRGFDITKEQQKAGDVPVISSSGIKSFHSEAKVKGPGVIIGRKGTLGSVHFSECDYWPHDTTLWSKELHGNNPRFVYYFLKILNLSRYDVGNSNPTLNRNHIHALEIQIPSLNIQNLIVETLSNYDDLIENNRRRIQLLEQSARSLYKEWFVHLRFPGHEHVAIVDGVPEGWEKGTISSFYKTSSGGTPSRKHPEFFTGDIKWVKTQELQESFILDTEEKITEEAVQKSSAKLFPENTVLVAMYGATIGQTGILATPATTNQACCALISTSEIAHFLYSFLFLRENKQQLINLSQGAAQNNINQEIIKNFPMFMPTKLLMSQFLDSAVPVFEQIKNLQQQIQNLEKARNLLLPRLMNGDIAV